MPSGRADGLGGAAHRVPAPLGGFSLSLGHTGVASTSGGSLRACVVSGPAGAFPGAPGMAAHWMASKGDKWVHDT